MSGVETALSGLAGSSILGSIVKAAVPALIKGIFSGGDEPDAPDVVEGPTTDPQAQIQSEEERLRALRRRRNINQPSLLSLEETTPLKTTGLIGR